MSPKNRTSRSSITTAVVYMMRTGIRSVQFDLKRLLTIHGSSYAVFGPRGLISKYPLRQRHRIFHSNAAVAKVAPRSGKELRSRRSVHVYIVWTGDIELHQAEGILSPWLLPDAQISRAKPLFDGSIHYTVADEHPLFVDGLIGVLC